MITLRLLVASGMLISSASPLENSEREIIELDLSGKTIGEDWKVTSGTVKVENKELVGTGAIRLESARTFSDDFLLTFEAMTEEKANIEIKLLDETGKRELYTFAFLGRYHTVLDGVKSAILKEDVFVKVDSRMWIFPGRFFKFKVERSGKDFKMFLNGQAGPEFKDPGAAAALKNFRIRILHDSESAWDRARFKNVKLEVPLRP